MSAKDTMAAAEKLYTSGYISYPRTETNIFPKELSLRPLVEAQTRDQRWGGEWKKNPAVFSGAVVMIYFFGTTSKTRLIGGPLFGLARPRGTLTNTQVRMEKFFSRMC